MWIECEVSKGQFSDELSAVVTDGFGCSRSYFIDNRYLDTPRYPKGDEKLTGKVEVMLIGEDETFALIAMPSRSLETNSQYVSVKKEKVIR